MGMIILLQIEFHGGLFFYVISDVMSSFILCLRSVFGNWIASDENMNIGNNSQ